MHKLLSWRFRTIFVKSSQTGKKKFCFRQTLPLKSLITWKNSRRVRLSHVFERDWLVKWKSYDDWSSDCSAKRVNFYPSGSLDEQKLLLYYYTWAYHLKKYLSDSVKNPVKMWVKYIHLLVVIQISLILSGLMTYLRFFKMSKIRQTGFRSFRGRHSGGPTRPDFFHPGSGWARFFQARHIPNVSSRSRPDRDRNSPIYPDVFRKISN